MLALIDRLAVLGICTLALLTGPASGQSLTLPQGHDALPGNASTSFPFNTAADQVWQWHYDSSNFGLAGITGPVEIVEISIRAASPAAMIPAFNFPDLEVQLIEASTDWLPNSHQANFAANVLSGSLLRTGPFLGGPVASSSTSTATWIPLGLASTFTYDPSSGHDLIVQIRKCGTGSLLGVPIDGVSDPSVAGAVLGNRYGHLSDCIAASANSQGSYFVPIVRVDYQPVAPAPGDIAVQSIVAPVSGPDPCTPLSAGEIVTIQIANVGSGTVATGDSIVLSCAVDGAIVIAGETLVLGQDLLPGQSLPYTFVGTVDLSASGTHVLTAGAAWSADANPLNDQLTVTVVSGGGVAASQLPFFENFDSFGAVNGTNLVPPGWSQDTNDGVGSTADWLARNGSTPTPGTGPAADHSTGLPGIGNYLYVEDSPPGEFPAVILSTPCIDLAGAGRPYLRFHLHSNDANGGGAVTNNHLHIDVLSFPGGQLSPDVQGAPIGHVGPDWTPIHVSLAAFSGQCIQIRFRASTNNQSFTHDIAIDDVAVFETIPGLGQAPVPGSAVIDVNAAFEMSGLPVSTLVTGPYYAAASLGGFIDFSAAGAANQPIIVLAGPLNAALLDLGPIGSLDIGTAFDPMSGLVSGIQIAFDGTSAAFPDALFRTDALGRLSFTAATPPFPLGPFAAIQALFFVPNSQVVQLSNAIEIWIVP